MQDPVKIELERVQIYWLKKHDKREKTSTKQNKRRTGKIVKKLYTAFLKKKVLKNSY
jgi:hypothetical protein